MRSYWDSEPSEPQYKDWLQRDARKVAVPEIDFEPDS